MLQNWEWLNEKKTARQRMKLMKKTQIVVKNRYSTIPQSFSRRRCFHRHRHHCWKGGDGGGEKKKRMAMMIKNY